MSDEPNTKYITLKELMQRKDKEKLGVDKYLKEFVGKTLYVYMADPITQKLRVKPEDEDRYYIVYTNATQVKKKLDLLKQGIEENGVVVIRVVEKKSQKDPNRTYIDIE